MLAREGKDFNFLVFFVWGVCCLGYFVLLESVVDKVGFWIRLW